MNGYSFLPRSIPSDRIHVLPPELDEDVISLGFLRCWINECFKGDPGQDGRDSMELRVTATTSIAAGTLVAAIGGQYVPYDVTNIAHATHLLGMALADAGPGDELKITLFGPVTVAGWNLTPEALYRAGTAGRLVKTELTNAAFSHVVGHAFSPTTFIFRPFDPVVPNLGADGEANYAGITIAGAKQLMREFIQGGNNVSVTYDASNDRLVIDTKNLAPSATTDTTTTANITDSTNKRFVTDAQRTAIQNTSGTNTGDETPASLKTKLGVASGSQDGYLTSGDWLTFNGKQAPIGYTPENVANKATSLSSPNSTSYPTTQAVATGLAAKLTTANNLSDLPSAATARTNLGLGDAAIKNTGTTVGTLAAGDDVRITGAAQKVSNLSDLTNIVTARTNLGLGTSAILNAPASGNAASGEVVKGDDTRLTDGRVPLGAAGGDLTGTYPSPTLATLANSGTGNFVKVAVDSKGRVTGTASVGPSDITSVLGYTPLSVSSNLNDLGNKATARTNLGIIGRTTFSNADYSVLTTDRYVAQMGSLTLPRTVTLPAASSVQAGWELIIADESGSVTTTNTLTITRTGTDTIAGATSEVIGAAYGWRRFISNGSNAWLMDRGVLRAVNNLSELSSVSTARTNLGLGTSAVLNVPATGDAASGEVVRGNDTRLTNSRTPSGSAGGDLTGTYPNPTVTGNAITNAKLAQVATATFKGRTTAGTGNVEDLTTTQATAMLDVFTSSAKGLVPSPGGTSNTTDFLRRDGTWAAPSGSATILTKTNGTATSQTLTFISGSFAHHRHSTTGNTTFTFASVTGMDGEQLTLRVTIGSAGHTIAVNDVGGAALVAARWPTGAIPAFKTTANTVYIMTFIVDNAAIRCTGITEYSS